MRRAGLAAALCLCLAACTCRDQANPGPDASARPRTVDVHTHLDAAALPKAVRLLDREGIAVAVNLSGGWPGAGLEESLAAARAAPGRVVTFATPLVWEAQRGGPYGARLARELEEAQRLGARGVKIFKALGLGVRGPDGGLLAVDDPSLDPLFEKAGELGLPVAIHTGDPVAFWQPATPENERWDELSVHPGWSYARKAVPSWEALFEGYERLVARHPKTTFIGVHFGNAPEDPERVGRMLAKYPNLYVDTAARVPELGRKDAAAMRALFIRWQDRILFGTDLGVGEAAGDLMFGSTGATPPGPADEERFYRSTWRWFETRDRGIPSPTPIQGRWSIDGIGLPEEVLRKIYGENAARVLGL